METEQELKAKKRANWIDKWRWGFVAFVVIVASVAVIFFFLRFDGFSAGISNLLNSATSIIVGIAIAYLLNPLVNFFDSLFYKGLKKIHKEPTAKKLAKGYSIALSIILFILAIVLLIWSIVPSLIASIASLVKNVPDQVQNAIETMKSWQKEETPLMQSLEGVITSATEYAENYVKTDLIPQAQNYVSMITSGVISVAKGIFNFVIGIIVAVYVLMIRDTLKGQSKKIIYACFKPKTANIVIKTARKTNDIFGGFITGKIIDSIIIGAIAYVGCLILQIPDSLLIAVIIGVTNIIPVFGPFIGAIPSLFLVVIQNPIQALYLLIFIIILQQVDGNIIGPKILGNSTGLSTFWVMFAILVGGGLWGFIGMLFGVPIFGVIYYILKQIIGYFTKKRKLPDNTDDYVEIDYVDEKTNEVVNFDHEKIREERRKEKEASRGKLARKVSECKKNKKGKE